MRKPSLSIHAVVTSGFIGAITLLRKSQSKDNWKRIRISVALAISITALALRAVAVDPPAKDSSPHLTPGEQAAAAGLLPQAPNFRLKDASGRTVQLSDFAGKVVVLNFWATWCAPCKAEVPWLIAAQKNYGSRGLVVIGIAVNDSPQAVERFGKEEKVNYPLLLGHFNTIDSYSALANAITGVPETFYVGRNGKLVNQHLGVLTEADLEHEIQAILQQMPAPKAGTGTKQK